MALTNRASRRADGLLQHPQPVFQFVNLLIDLVLRRMLRVWRQLRLEFSHDSVHLDLIPLFITDALGQPLRSKGFEHRELTVTWTVLVHNLWVLARLPRADAAQARAA